MDMEVYSKVLKMFFYVILLFFMTACATVMYEGEKREIHEVAVLMSSDTLIEYIDGKKPPLYSGGGHAIYHLLPGQYQLDVTLMKMGYPLNYRSDESIKVSFIAKAGREYVVYPVINRGKWAPAVRDRETKETVSFFRRRR